MSYIYKTYPEMSHDVDLHGFFNHIVRAIQEFLSRDNTGIVDQNIYLANLLFYLQSTDSNFIKIKSVQENCLGNKVWFLYQKWILPCIEQ